DGGDRVVFMVVMLMWRGYAGSHGGAAVVVTGRWWLWRGGGVEGCGVGGCGGGDGGIGNGGGVTGGGVEGGGA
nr:hypothetical protein [Tanacetum cinerariifolium]